MSRKHIVRVVLILIVLAAGRGQAAPVACWHFDEGAGTAAADECGGHEATLQQGAAWQEGACGSAVALDGYTGHVTAPNLPGLDGMMELTIEAWVYLVTNPSGGRDVAIAAIYGPGHTQDDSYRFAIAPNGHLSLTVSDGNPLELPDDQYLSIRYSRDPIPLGRWVHVCGTFAPALEPPFDPIRLYMNFEDNSGDYSPYTGQQTQYVQDTTQDLWMGRNELDEHLCALIDEVRIRDDVHPPTPSCPIALFDFEAACGGTIPDETGNGHDLTALNCAGLASRQDLAGQAANMDGTDDILEAPDAPDLHSLDWLIVEASVFPIAPIPHKNPGIVTKWASGGAEDDCFLLAYANDGRLWGAVNGSVRVDVWSEEPIPTLAWSRARMVYNGSSLRLFVDDVQVGSTPADVGALSDAAVPLLVGGSDFDVQSAGSFWGYIDDVAIYGEGTHQQSAVDETAPGALSPLQVMPNPAQGVTHIRFENGTAATVTLRVFDSLGRLVRAVPGGARAPGFQQMTWDGRNESGHEVSSGVYLYKIDGVAGTIASGRGLLVK